MCINDLEELKIQMTFEEIQNIKLSKFKTILKEQTMITAFQYLKANIQTKGKSIKYDTLKISEYLLPNNYLSIEDKKLIFSLRTQTFQIVEEEKWNIVEKCICYEDVDPLHLYECESLNENTTSIKYNMIYEDNMKQMKPIVNRIRQSSQKLQSSMKERDQKFKINT